ncbi:MAG: hypothetical protein WBN89_10950 [Prochlorococcaceae cyanobacterium]
MTSVQHKQVRQLLWLYFWLLIFEGALRKWILPGLSTPLLLVRDPVAIAALWIGAPLLRQSRFQSWLQWLSGIAIPSFFLAMVVGHGDLITAVYGTSILLIQFPLIFLYAAAFDRDGVLRFAKVLLLISIPMTLLIVAQSNLPDGHILNVAPGGDQTAAFWGALGRSRPPGTFSFINGVVGFYGLAAAALFARLYGMNPSPGRLMLIFSAGVALVVAAPVSISRGLVFGYAVVVLAVIASLLLTRARLVPLISGLLAILLVLLVGSSIPAFRDTSEAFAARWTMANANEGEGRGVQGVVQRRVLGGFIAAFENQDSAPVLGLGIGMGTNIGARRLGAGSAFLIAEDSWPAILGEMGLLVGFMFIAWRLALTLFLLFLSLRAAAHGNRLPLIFLGASFLPLLSGGLNQPTSIGFIVVSAGLTWAATTIPKQHVFIPIAQVDPFTLHDSVSPAPSTGQG